MKKTVLLFSVLLLMSLLAVNARAQDDRALARVNGKPITEQDLQLQYLTRHIPPEQQPLLRERFLNDLIDQRLMQEYLQEQNVRVNEARVEESLAQVYKIIREADRNPAEVLQRLGLNEKMLRDELRLPLAWQVHLEEQVPPEKLRQFFESRQRQFDGTELHLRQIFLKVPNRDAEETVLNKLAALRQQIEAEQISFAAAARKYSEAPTADQGGDLGLIPYEGVMPTSITGPAFSLQQGEISEPFLSPFGAHLMQVIDVKPGELSLEDVRTEVWTAMSESVWNNIVSTRRKEAKIEWLDSTR